MNEPTQEQIKRFWEWCGFEDSYESNDFWWGLNSQKQLTALSLDLNNLSQYAIPKLIKEYRNWKSVLHDWVDSLTGDREKDALSLYWFLAQTML